MKRSIKAQLWAAIVLAIVIATCYLIVFRTSAKYNITGEELWLGAMWLQLIAALAVLPALTATAICVERQQGSLELLLATPLSAAEIVFGKYLARMTIGVMMLAAALPFEIVATFRGGLDPGLALLSALILVVAMANAGALALLCSALFRVSATAVGVAYAAVGAWAGLPLVAAQLMDELGELPRMHSPGEKLVATVSAMSPVSSLALTPRAFVDHGGYGGSPFAGPAIALGILMGVVLTALSLSMTVAFLRRG